MPEWPSADQHAVYIPPARASEPESGADIRARIAGARIRQGLAVSDEILSEIIAGESASAPSGMFTEAERQDIDGDNERITQARAIVAGAEDVFGDLQVCWHHGRRGVRVLLTGQHERYRQLLSEVIEPDRLVIDSAKVTEAEVRGRERDVRAHVEQLAEQGIFLTGHGSGLNGFEISYLAADHDRAERVLRDRFGEFATIRYDGASNHTFRPMAFGSWLADEDRLHLFYGLPRNGERAAGGQVFETEHAVIVALTILDWRGAKTLIGGFIASHATVELRAPLGDRVVIDDSENRSRPHWTQAKAADHISRRWV
jgi:hypothetical protein